MRIAGTIAGPMGAAAADLKFEIADHLHANFGAVALESPPGEWVEILRVHSGAVRRVTLSWRRGSGPYVPIPGSTLELPDLLEAKKSDDEADKPAPDQRLSDPSKWALDVATGRWRVGVEWAKKNGPVIDVQLAAWAYDQKKGQLSIIKGAISAKRINLTGEGAAWMDGPAPGTPEYLTLALLSALDKKDERMNQQIDAITGHYSKVGEVLNVVVDVGRRLLDEKNNGSMAAAFDRAADRGFLLEMMKLRMMGEGIDKALAELVPVAKEFATAWAARPKDQSPSRIASELLASITDEQRGKFKAGGLAELMSDVEQALQKIADAKDDLMTIRNVLNVILPAMHREQRAMGPLLTEAQRTGFVALVRAAGLETA